MPIRYDPAAFEPKWRRRWQEAALFRTREEAHRPKFYGLDFFPYPSGAGLSVGHLRNYIPTDVLCRMKHMQGFNVLHPMGWDAFGLPAEAEAVKRQIHPAAMVQQYAETYKRQEDLVGITYDWSREINSSSPDFYRWTQWLFLILYRRGLAYHGDYPANWCPNCQTVLANEEVEGGLCWRCGTPAVKKMLKQWFFRITSYAERLLEDLKTLQWPDGIKMQQQNWIGRSEGVEFEWRVSRIETSFEKSDSPAPGVTVEATTFEEVGGLSFSVFTTRIDTVFGATFCVLAPEHPLVPKITAAHRRAEVDEYVASAGRLSEQDRLAATREKTGVYIGAHARNPFSGANVPIWIADYVLLGYGTGAIMAVPAHDARDHAFAEKYSLEIIQVIAPESFLPVELPFESEDGILVNSGEFTDLECTEAQKQMGEWAQAQGFGRVKTNYRLRDWLISRQRYWGSPIPIIHCEKCGAVPVPESELPVLLPEVDHYEPSGSGESPLATMPFFVNVKCPQCNGDARRETDTMSGFACSSWYFLRFCDPHNREKAFDKKHADYWMPVDCYVGGAEHAVLHLLYARFCAKVLFDDGQISVGEPFSILRNQGMLLAPTPFRKAREKEVLHVGEEGIQITYDEAAALPQEEVFWRWEKMSKSKGNVVTPDEAVEKYGADALRLYELFEAPFEQTIQWSEERIQGAIRFLHRVFKISDDFRPRFVADWKNTLPHVSFTEDEKALRRKTHFAIQKLTADIDAFAFNTAVAAMMEYSNSISDFLKAHPSGESANAVLSEAIETLLKLLSLFAPHSADEIWEEYGFNGFVYQTDWPKEDPRWLVQETATIALQVNGKLRATLQAPAGASEEALEKLALDHEKVRQFVEGLTVRRVIVVPEKLVNVVAS